jgi:hypothetical protein
LRGHREAQHPILKPFPQVCEFRLPLSDARHQLHFFRSDFFGRSSGRETHVASGSPSSETDELTCRLVAHPGGKADGAARFERNFGPSVELERHASALWTHNFIAVKWTAISSATLAERVELRHRSNELACSGRKRHHTPFRAQHLLSVNRQPFSADKSVPSRTRDEAPATAPSDEARAGRQQICSCAEGWVCEDHPDQPYEHDGCVGAGMLCQNPDCVIGRTLRAELDARRQGPNQPRN